MRADVPLADLLLDPENPRLDIQEGHREAVRANARSTRSADVSSDSSSFAACFTIEMMSTRFLR
jgi:hypothetical protein